MKKFFVLLLPFLFFSAPCSALSVFPTTGNENTNFTISDLPAFQRNHFLVILQEGIKPDYLIYEPPYETTYAGYGMCGYIWDPRFTLQNTSLTSFTSNIRYHQPYGKNPCDFSLKASHNFKIAYVQSGSPPIWADYTITSFASHDNNTIALLPFGGVVESLPTTLAAVVSSSTASIWFLILIAVGLPLAFWVINKVIEMFRFERRAKKDRDKSEKKIKQTMKEYDKLSKSFDETKYFVERQKRKIGITKFP